MEYDDFMGNDEEINELIEKYENTKDNGLPYYFDSDDYNVIVEYYLQKNEWESALEAAEKAKMLHPSDNTTKLIMAKVLVFEHKSKKALQLLKEIGLEHNDLDFLLTLAGCYADLGKHKKSIEAYQKALESVEDFDQFDIYSNMAFEYEALGDIEHSLEYIKKSLGNNHDIEDKYHDIRQNYLQLNRNDECVEFFKSLIDKNPYDKEAWLTLGDTYRSTGLLEKAAEQYEYALSIDPKYRRAYENLSVTLAALNKLKDTIEIIEEAIKNKVETSSMLCLLGESYHALNNDEKAIEYFNTVLKKDVTNDKACSGLAHIMCDRGDLKSALQYIDKALSDIYPDPELYRIKTELLIINEQYSKALTQLNIYESYVGQNYETVNIRIDIHLKQNKPDLAVKDINNAIKHSSDYDMISRLLYNKAEILFTSSRDEEALNTLDTAIRTAPIYFKDFLELNPDFKDDMRIIDLYNEICKKGNKN